MKTHKQTKWIIIVALCVLGTAASAEKKNRPSARAGEQGEKIMRLVEGPNHTEPAPEDSSTVRYEAEGAFDCKGTAYEDQAASGTLYMKYIANKGYIEWGFDSDGGEVCISLRTYSPRNTRSANVLVNGIHVGTIVDSDNTWKLWQTLPVNLNPGKNTVRIQIAEESVGSLHVDYMEVTTRK